MPGETAMGAAVRLTISMEAAAALAAHVRVNAEGLEVDPHPREPGTLHRPGEECLTAPR